MLRNKIGYRQPPEKGLRKHLTLGARQVNPVKDKALSNSNVLQLFKVRLEWIDSLNSKHATRPCMLQLIPCTVTLQDCLAGDTHQLKHLRAQHCGHLDIEHVQFWTPKQNLV